MYSPTLILVTGFSILLALIWIYQPPSVYILRGITNGPLVRHPHDNWESHLLPVRPRQHGYFLHITDMHIDEGYVSGATVESACHKLSRESDVIQVGGPLGAPGAKCDSPVRLAQETLDWVARNWRDKLDFVVWTGDNARHDWDKTRMRKRKDIYAINRQVTDMVKNAFWSPSHPPLPVVPCLGNNDVFPHNAIDDKDHDLLSFYEKLWRPWIPNNQRKSFRQGAYFATQVAPHLRILSINTLLFFNRNPLIDDCGSKNHPGDAQLAWMNDQLGLARRENTRIYIMGHVPPSARDFRPACLDNYMAVVSRYGDVVMGQFFGHLNMDHFMLYDSRQPTNQTSRRQTDNEGGDVHATRDIAEYVHWLRDMYSALDPITSDPNKLPDHPASPLVVLQIAPSVLPIYWPAIRIYRYETNPGSSYGTLLGYAQYHANQVSYEATPAKPLEYQLEYTTDTLYGMPDLSPESYHALAKQMVMGDAKGNATWTAYIRNMFVQARNDEFN
ncbi:Metallo-dependent phosphatase-like protein [Phycomyces nitens]|nr:Metallo-dependent phosphatase-like protein [Phycomyces nitens]